PTRPYTAVAGRASAAHRGATRRVSPWSNSRCPTATGTCHHVPVTGLMSDYDRERSSELRRARRRATALLVAVGAVFVSTFWMGDATWLGFLRPTAEASVIGGLSDWFSVTALVRLPLGIPLLTSAHIPRKLLRLSRC